MGNTNSTPQFTVSLVEEDGRKEWVIYDDLGGKIPVDIFPSREECEQFIQKFHRQAMALAEITSLAKTAVAGWFADISAKYNLCHKDLDELMRMGVDDALREVLPA
jgi:hypothetical protein